VIDAIVGELEPIQKEAQQYEQDPDLVRSIIIEGCDTARESARETLSEVRTAMGLTTW
jgi:tryptophanyl-tRNA synthetase